MSPTIRTANVVRGPTFDQAGFVEVVGAARLVHGAQGQRGHADGTVEVGIMNVCLVVSMAL